MHFLSVLKFCDLTRLLLHFALKYILEEEKGDCISAVPMDSGKVLHLSLRRHCFQSLS